MNRRARAQDPSTGAPARPPRTDVTGAIYGSLLAACVVAGAGAFDPYPRAELVLLVLCTGVVFWAAHVYARLVGERLIVQSLTWSVVRRVCADEWPIAQAAVPPAIAVAISALLGIGWEATLWLALAVAVAGQVGWATLAVIRAGATRGLALTAGAVNLVLGLLIVVLKVALEP